MKKVITTFLLLVYSFVAAQDNYEQLYHALNLELGLRTLAENTLQDMKGYNATLTDAKVSEVLSNLNYGKFKNDIINELKANIASNQVDTYLATGTVSEIITGEDLLLYEVGKTAGRDLMFQIINLLKVDPETNNTTVEQQGFDDDEYSIPTRSAYSFCKLKSNSLVLVSPSNVWTGYNMYRPYFKLCSSVSGEIRRVGRIFHEELGLIGSYILYPHDIVRQSTYSNKMILDYNSLRYRSNDPRYDNGPFKTLQLFDVDPKLKFIKNLKIDVSEEYQTYLETERLSPQEDFVLRDLPITVCEKIDAGYTHDVEDIKVTLPHYERAKVNDEGTRGYIYNDEGVILATYAFDDDTCIMNGDGTRTYNTLKIKAIRDLNFKEGECLDFHVDELCSVAEKVYESEVPQRMAVFYYDKDGDGYHRLNWTGERLAGSSTMNSWWTENTLGIDCNDNDKTITDDCHNCNNNSDPNCGQERLIWYYDGDQDYSYGQILEQDEYPGKKWSLQILFALDPDDTNPNIR